MNSIPDETNWCCIQCHSALFARSVRDPKLCMHCAPAQRYHWRRCRFGRMRRVPPLEAARW